MSSSFVSILHSLWTGEENDIENNARAVNEQKGEDDKIKTKTLKMFGSNPQPALEKVEFKVC